MSVSQSNITDLNYDLVVGVSQTGMNGIMKTYYQNAADYFFQDSWYFIDSQNVDQNYAVSTLGVDPFSIPSWNGKGAMPTAIEKCINGRFTCAFNFMPGDPGDGVNFPVSDYNYLTYQPNLSNLGNPVFNYTLCCQQIQVVYWDPIENIWVNYNQPTTAHSPITSIVKFCSIAHLGKQKVSYNSADPSVPSDVKKQAAAFEANGISFQIQQVLLLLDTMMASPMTTLPFMPTLNQTYYELLAPCFQYAYAQALKNSFKKQPVLVYGIQQTNQENQTALNPTDVQITMEQLVDSNGNVVTGPTPSQLILDSFNYICSVNGSAPVPAKQFNWNWFDTIADINGNSSYNGAIAISKFALGSVFYNQLKNYVQNNCWVPQITCTNDNGKDAWTFSMSGAGPLDSDPVTKDNYNNDFLLYMYYPEPFTTHGINNPNDYVTITTFFEMEVSIKDSKTISVTQQAKFNYTISLNGEKAMGGTPLNNSYSEDYSVAVTPTGMLIFQAGAPTISNNGVEDNIPYLTDAESAELLKSIDDTEKNMQSAGLTAEPLGTAQQVIFPGGNAFSFYDVQFTERHDLACKINYLKTTA